MEPIPEGFNLIAVGEVPRDAHGVVSKTSHDPERVKLDRYFHPFRVRIFLEIESVGIAQRSPTAIDSYPSG